MDETLNCKNISCPCKSINENNIRGNLNEKKIHILLNRKNATRGSIKQNSRNMG